MSAAPPLPVAAMTPPDMVTEPFCCSLKLAPLPMPAPPRSAPLDPPSAVMLPPLMTIVPAEPNWPLPTPALVAPPDAVTLPPVMVMVPPLDCFPSPMPAPLPSTMSELLVASTVPPSMRTLIPTPPEGLDEEPIPAPPSPPIALTLPPLMATVPAAPPWLPPIPAERMPPCAMTAPPLTATVPFAAATVPPPPMPAPFSPPAASTTPPFTVSAPFPFSWMPTSQRPPLASSFPVPPLWPQTIRWSPGSDATTHCEVVSVQPSCRIRLTVPSMARYVVETLPFKTYHVVPPAVPNVRSPPSELSTTSASGQVCGAPY